MNTITPPQAGRREWIGLVVLMLPTFTLMSLGFGFTFTLTIDLVIAAAPPERAGAASALAETGAEFGGALGLAVLGSLGTAVYRSQVAAALPPGIAPDAAEAIQDTLGGAMAAAAQLPGELGAALLDAAREAFILGLQLNAFIGTAVMVGLAVLTVTLLRRIDIDPGPESQSHPEPDSLTATGVCAQ